MLTELYKDFVDYVFSVCVPRIYRIWDDRGLTFPLQNGVPLMFYN